MMQFTIESDEEVEPEVEVSEFEDNFDNRKKKNKKDKSGKNSLEKLSNFSLEFDDGQFHGVINGDSDDERYEDEGDEEIVGPGDNVRTMPRAEERAIRAELKQERRSKQQRDAPVQPVDMDTKEENAFFDTVLTDSVESQDTLFTQLNLSRSLLRGIEATGYVTPTPVQAKVIPLALAGRDVCASAVTGSGKTAAFVLPFLERLLFRPRDVAAIRVLIVTPTRELATQIHNVLEKLSKFTDVTFALICGGKKDVKSQEVTLRNRPDIVICTPGRILDHLRNSHSVSVDTLDVLVLDEADRLLELGFQDDLEELMKYIPRKRQTMLFSATMTPRVEDLVKLSLSRPVRVKVNSSSTQVAPRLIQEFVKVRNDEEKEALVLSLLSRNFGSRTIVFFELKKDAHRFAKILTLSKMKACELHGDLTQALRYQALEQFTKGAVDIMVATDVAARGLDIPGVLTVVNAEMPRSVSTYIHRVGRTARAGCGGRAVTFVTDDRRKVMKDLVKGEGCGLSVDGGRVLSRTIPSEVVSHYIGKIAKFESQIVEMMIDERNTRRVENVTSEIEKAENLILYNDEIKARPARTWHQTETQKSEVKEAARESHRGKIGEKRKNFKDESTQDEFKDVDKDEGARNHRVSRKKRRRLEALKDMEETAANPHALAPRPKIKQRKLPENYEEGLLSTIGLHHNKKVARPKFAVGGSDQDLFGSEPTNGKVGKHVMKQLAKEKAFTDFDPNKRLRKGGKLGSKSFKSKSRFKRR